MKMLLKVLRMVVPKMLNKLKRFDLLKSLYYEDANLIHETEKMVKTLQDNLEQMQNIQKRVSNLLEFAAAEIQNTNSETDIKLSPPDLPDVIPGAENINDFGDKAAKEIPIGEFRCDGSVLKRVENKPQVKVLSGFKAKPATEG